MSMNDEAGVVPGIEMAVKAAGSQTELARLLGNVTQQAISVWVAQGRIPFDRINDVARVTGVPRRVLAPELFEACPACGN